MNSILTVVTPAENTSLVSLDDVKTLLNLQDDSADDRLEILIEQASAAASSYCRRVFPLETVSEQFRLTKCTDVLRLARYPLVEIVSIEEDGTELDEDEYEIDPKTGFVYRLEDDERINWETGKIVVQYSAGYVVPDDEDGDTEQTLPKDLEAGVMALVRGAYFAAARDPMVRSESIPDVLEQQFWVGDIPSSGDMPAEIKAKLDPYRNMIP